MQLMGRKKKVRRFLIEIAEETRRLLDQEAARVQEEHGAKPSGGKIVDRIVKEWIGSRHGTP
jgi:hypothetical protein